MVQPLAGFDVLFGECQAVHRPVARHHEHLSESPGLVHKS